MADEYISREAAIALCDTALEKNPMSCAKGIVVMRDLLIYHAPAADVVKIIRCKDCRYKDHDGFCTGRGYPEQLVPDNGYCYKAKKMDESEDEDNV